jgi:parvulin-like peptidyl-prolyl isomerase
MHKLLKSAKNNLKSKRTIIVVALIAVLVILAVSFNLNRFVSKSNVAATINGNEITVKQLDAKYDFFFFLTGYPESYKQLITKESFLNQLINEELLLQEAAKERISVLDKEVEDEVSLLISKSPISKDEFEIQLNNAGFSMKDLYDYYKNQMLISKLLNKTFPDTEINDTEAKKYYDENSESYVAQEGQIRLRHILVETKEEADAILAELKTGKDFAKLAKENSTCPSAEKGGDLGFVSKGQMVPEFEEAAFKLNVNQLSVVVKTQFGYHIIKREPDKIPFSEAKDSIKELLKLEKQRELLKTYLDGLKSKANIVILLKTTEQTGNLTATSTGDQCYSNYKLSSDTVIFYHAEWCPHCQNMMPIVQELESEGYKFHWVETTSGKGMDVVDACFKDLIQGGVPEFICAGTQEVKMGEMSKAALKTFADNCKK